MSLSLCQLRLDTKKQGKSYRRVKLLSRFFHDIHDSRDFLLPYLCSTFARQIFGELWSYDLAAQTWELLSSPSERFVSQSLARWGHTSTLVPAEMVAGDDDGSSSGQGEKLVSPGGLLFLHGMMFCTAFLALKKGFREGCFCR